MDQEIQELRETLQLSPTWSLPLKKAPIFQRPNLADRSPSPPPLSRDFVPISASTMSELRKRMTTKSDCFTLTDTKILKTILGKGTFGTVHKVCLKSQPRDCPYVAKKITIKTDGELPATFVKKLFEYEVFVTLQMGRLGIAPQFHTAFYCRTPQLTGMVVTDLYHIDGDDYESLYRSPPDLLARVYPLLARLHRHRVIHRDMGLRNLIYRIDNPQEIEGQHRITEIKLIDFGLALYFPSGEKLPKGFRVLALLDYLDLARDLYKIRNPFSQATFAKWVAPFGYTSAEVKKVWSLQNTVPCAIEELVAWSVPQFFFTEFGDVKKISYHFLNRFDMYDCDWLLNGEGNEKVEEALRQRKKGKEISSI